MRNRNEEHISATMGHATEGKRGDKTQSLLVSSTDSCEGNKTAW